MCSKTSPSQTRPRSTPRLPIDGHCSLLCFTSVDEFRELSKQALHNFFKCSSMDAIDAALIGPRVVFGIHRCHCILTTFSHFFNGPPQEPLVGR